MPGGQSTLNLALKDLAPWTPDIDARKSEKPQIMSGQNFRDDIDGPRSAFASSLVNWNYWDSAARTKVQSLHTANGTLYGTGSGVWKINPATGLAEILLAVAVVNTYWPWTIALVGGLYYFAQYDIGLWQYDPVAETLAHVDTPAGDTIRYVNTSYGRLIYLTDTVVGISALDDGTDLTPDLASAAQAQPLSMVGGFGYRIEALSDGFIVYQSEGVMRATFTQQAYVFQFDRQKGKPVKIFSPNAGVYVPTVGAISIDETGLNLIREYNYQDAGTSNIWEPVMSDYIKKNILDVMNKNLYGTINMYYSDDLQLLFINFSSSTVEGTMNIGFVYSPVNKKWGSFDHQNTGVFELYDPLTNTFSTGYMALDGFMRQFEETDFSEDLPPSPTAIEDYIYRPLATDELVRTIDDPAGTFVQVGYTIINFSDNNPQFYANYQNSGLYYINFTPYSDTANDNQADPAMVIANPIIGGTYINVDTSGGIELIALPYVLPEIGINSNLQIGPFRFSDQVKADETSMVVTIMIGGAAVQGFVETEDWLDDLPAEDWLSGSGMEDWGSGTATPSVYDLTLRDTNDGVSAPIQGDEILFVFLDLGAALVFKPIGYSSIWHNLTLSCTEPGQSFALKTIDFEGMLTGLLQSS